MEWMITQVAVRHRTPLEQLVSEALYRIQEALTIFPEAVMLSGGGTRGEALRELVRTARIDLPTVDRVGSSEVVISPELEPENCSGSPFGWCDGRQNSPLMIYPLANWNEAALEAFLGVENRYSKNARLLKICVVGDTDSGKSDLIAELLGEAGDPSQENPRPRHYWTDSRLLILRETRGIHASDLAVIAAGWESDWAILTVNAKVGLNAVTRRLLFLLALSGVPQLVVVVTGLEVVEEPEATYTRLLKRVNHLLISMSRVNLTGIIPENAGTNSWYQGESLAVHLDRVVTPSAHLDSLRLPVQRAWGGRFSGLLCGGVLALGDELVSLPSGEKARVDGLWLQQQAQEKLYAGDLVTLTLDRELVLESGDWLAKETSFPVRSSELDATLLWLDGEPPQDSHGYRLYHCARLVDAHVTEVASCLQPDSHEWNEGDALEAGKVGHVSLTTGKPLYFDSFFQNRAVGRFVLLHREEMRVVGIGIVRGELRKHHDVTSAPQRLASEHVVVDPTEVSLRARRKRYGHRGAVLWFTGLSGSGKSAVAKETEKKLFERGCHTLFLDGDNVRSGVSGDLGFTVEERSESTRRVAELAALVREQGQIVICSFISGSKEDRDFARSLVRNDFYLCFVDCPVEVCRSRDPKGLYEKADAGELLSFTGVSLPYEEPRDAELVLDSDTHDPEFLSRCVIEMLEERGVI